MRTETQIWEGIKIKFSTIDPRHDLWQVGYIIGYNPFSHKLIVCDSEGYPKHAQAIRNNDGTELSREQYDAVLREIKQAGMRALYEIRNNGGLSTY